MSHRYMGPFTVKHQDKNDVDCQHLATGQMVRVSVSDVKLFPGDRDTAYKMALRDHEQHVIDKILYYKGDRDVRSTMTFTVRFQDGDVREVPYSKDLFDSIPYAEFCSSKRYLYHLIYSTLKVLRNTYQTFANNRSLSFNLVISHMSTCEFMAMFGMMSWIYQILICLLM